jgi:hypothetical protein
MEDIAILKTLICSERNINLLYIFRTINIMYVYREFSSEEKTKLTICGSVRIRG